MAKKRKPAKASPERAETAADDGTASIDNAPKEKGETADDDVHAEALKQYERGYLHDRFNIEGGYEDLRFMVNDDEAQWDPKARAQRVDEDRPCLTANKCPQFVRQVTGDIRQMRPAIKCVPVDDKATQEVAEKVLPGMLRYIENRSDAQGAYFTAADSQVAAGMGHLRVLTEFARGTTTNQEIRVSAINDGIAVIWDPDSDLLTREDAMFCFVPTDMSLASFKKKWPDASPDPLPNAPAFFSDWHSGEMVRVAEYWRKTPAKRRFASLPDGAVEDITEGEPDDLPPDAKIEERDGYKLERYLITASEILEGPDEWPTADIPIVPMIGEELTIGRRKVRRGIIRALKDPARAYNYAFSTETEVIALQPKAPFIGTRKHFEKYLDQWETANSRNWPFLEFEIDPAAPGMKPERVQPPVGSVGLQQLMETTSADMSAVTGIYPASLGAHSNETSGKAIVARQREGDTGTFVYIDNFARAVKRVGQIVVNLIPFIYDTERVFRIVGEDGKTDTLQINQAALHPNDGMTPITLNDVTVGAYDVVIEMGPSYSTKREEARDGMQTFMQALGPQAAPMFIDLLAKMQDWPLADQIAKRAKFMLPPQIQQAEAAEAGEQLPPMPPPAPPSPEQQMALEKHQADIQQGQMKLQVDAGRLQFEQQKHQDGLSLDQQRLQVELAKINAELETARMGHQATMAGHAATIDAAAAGAAPAPDPRVDQLAEAVTELRDVVVQLAQAVMAPHPHPPPQGDVGGVPPVPGVPSVPPVDPNQPPPPGGVLMPGQAPAGVS